MARHSKMKVTKRFMGTPIEVEPHDAVLQCLYIAAGEVVYCNEMIEELEEMEYWERPEKELVVRNGKGRIELLRQEYGPEMFNRFVRMRSEAMDRVTRYAKIAMDAGVDERATRILEAQLQLVIGQLDKAFDRAGITRDQRKEIGRALRQLETAEDLVA